MMRWPLFRSRYMELALLLFSLLLVSATLLLGYNLKRALVVNVGDLGDSPLVRDFYADEADLTYRYRWSRGHSEVLFTGAGSAKPAFLSLRAQGARPSGTGQPPTMTVSVNGVRLYPEVITLTASIKEYDIEFVRSEAAPGQREINVPPAPYVMTLDVSTFRPPGDERDLGIKVDLVELLQDSAGTNWPPLWMVVWPLALVCGLYGLCSLLPTPFRLVPPLLLAFLLAGLLLIGETLYTAVYLPPVAAVGGLAGLLTWQRQRLSRWPLVFERLRAGSLASALMLAAMLVYAGVALMLVPQVSWIGHADYAENAVIARNLVEGRGFTVDYVAQFYRDYPGITHPAETWPLLQPLLIAPFFAVLGPQTWAAKLPNLLLLLALTWSVFHAALSLWDGRVALLSGLLTLAHPYFFNAVLYPINDLPFTLIFFLLAWRVWLACSGEPQGRSASTRAYLLIGALAGLLIWSKPSGALLLAGLGTWALWRWLRHKPVDLLSMVRELRTRERWWPLLATAVAALAVLLPLIVRNFIAFGRPFFTTEGYDAWITRYWPFYDAENIYKVYAGGELPAARWVIGGKFGYQNLVDAVITNFKWVWLKGVMGTPGRGEYVLGFPYVAGAFLGLVALTRRTASIFGMVGVSLGMYALFVLIYWHFEGRYFQVVVPWLYMLLAWAIVWLWDQLRSYIVGHKGRGWGLLALPIVVAAFLWPSVATIQTQAETDTTPISFVTDMNWLAQNSSQSDVIMTRDPWEVNWYTRRKTIMIPNEDLPTIQRIAGQYGVTILQLGGPGDSIDITRCPSDPSAREGAFPTGSRAALGRLYCGLERPGYKLTYKNKDLTVYRLTTSR